MAPKGHGPMEEVFTKQIQTECVCYEVFYGMGYINQSYLCVTR